jgi:hypothetical protein
MNDVTSEVQPVEESKAVRVASDVLAHLSVYRVYVGRYLQGRVPGIGDKDVDLSCHLAAVEENCDVCALGALLLSKARLYDNIPISSLAAEYSTWRRDAIEVSGTTIRRHLGDVFSQHQLHMIESAFEMCSIVESPGLHEECDISDSVAFGRRYNSSRERLGAIMENIVENKGQFKPPRFFNPRVEIVTA